VFLGGWSLGFGTDRWIADLSIAGFGFGGLVHLGVFVAKLIAFILFFILVRWTLPRFRYDQLMKLGWVVFFEAALINVFLAALVVAVPHLTALILAIGAVLLLVVTVAIVWAARVSEPAKPPLRA
jgi:NADH-quinone oxidoreductase subunit H